MEGQPAASSLCYKLKGDLETFVEYWLGGRFKNFDCVLMVPEGYEGRLFYSVYGDDKKLLQGDDLGKERKAARITLSVDGVRVLRLKISGDRQVEKLRVVWANPILTEPKDDE